MWMDDETDQLNEKKGNLCITSKACMALLREDYNRMKVALNINFSM
jgi:hypothetical protein